MPATAATFFVPDSTPLAGFVPMAIVTLSVALVIRLPAASSMRTVTAGVMALLAGGFVGCWANDSLLLAPAATANGALVALASPVALATSV